MLFGYGPKGSKFANTGVGKNDIDSPLQLRDRVVETVEIGQIGNVSLNARNIAADCLYSLVEFFLGDGPVMKTYAPSFTNSFAVANPIPSVPPVMRAILSLSFLDILYPPLLPSCNELPMPRCILYQRSVLQELRTMIAVGVLN